MAKFCSPERKMIESQSENDADVTYRKSTALP